MPESKMICPRCGAEMNRHAVRIDYSAALDDAEAVDAYMGGVLEEFHTCPRCGDTEMRRAVDENEEKS